MQLTLLGRRLWVVEMLFEDRQYLCYPTSQFCRFCPSRKAHRFLSKVQNNCLETLTLSPPVGWVCKLYSLNNLKHLGCCRAQTMLVLQRTSSQATSKMSRQVQLLPSPSKPTVRGDRGWWYSTGLILVVFFVIIL